MGFSEVVETTIALPMAVTEADIQLVNAGDQLFSTHQDAIKQELLSLLLDEASTWQSVEDLMRLKVEALVERKVMTLLWDQQTENHFDDFDKLSLVYSVDNALLVGFTPLPEESATLQTEAQQESESSQTEQQNAQQTETSSSSQSAAQLSKLSQVSEILQSQQGSQPALDGILRSRSKVEAHEEEGPDHN